MKCACGHGWHDGPCTQLTLTDHFEGTNHGGIVPCGCTVYEPDDDDGPVDEPGYDAFRWEATTGDTDG